MSRYLPIGSSGDGGEAGGAGPTDLASPSNVQVEATDLSYSVSWNAVSGARGYEVRLNSGPWQFTATNSFQGTGSDGEDQVVDVRAILFGGFGASSPFELDNPTPLVVQPVYVTGRFSAIDTATDLVNGNTAVHSITVPPGFQGMMLTVMHAELNPGLFWSVVRDGVTARELFVQDGYAGDSNGTYTAGNKLFRAFFINRPSEGTASMTLTGREGSGGSVSNAANELATITFLIDKTADIDFPFRAFARDISGTARGSETETLGTSLTDLVLHLMGHSQTIGTEGALGAGETFLLRANDNTGDASILSASKPGSTPTTTVGSTGFDPDFCLQGVALAIMGLGEPEYKALADNTRGTKVSPIGSAPGTISFSGGHWSGNNAGENVLMISSPSFSGDHYAEMTWDGGTFSRVLCRLQNDTAVNCYALTVTASQFEIRKLSDGGTIDYSHVIGAVQTPPQNFVAGDRIGLYASGTTTTRLDVYFNGHLLYTTTDSSSPYTGGHPGLARFGSGNIASKFYACDGPVSFDR